MVDRQPVWTCRALDRQVRLWIAWSDECVEHALGLLTDRTRYTSPAIEEERAYNLRRRIERNPKKWEAR